MPTRLVPLVLVAALAGPAAGAAGAGDTPPGVTMKDYRAMSQRFVQETFVDVYGARADPEAPWDRDARNCIEGAARWFAGLPERRLMSTIFQPGRRAVKAGCEDPILLYALGYAEGSADRVRTAVEAMTPENTPVHRRAFAHLRLARLLSARDRDAEARPHFETGVELLVEMIEQGVYGPGTERLLFQALEAPIDNELPLDLATALCNRLERLPDLDPWVRHACLGVYHIRVAWKWRGSGWAWQVTDEGWHGFYTHLGKAYHHLYDAHALAPDRPEAAAYLIKVAMGGSTLPLEDEAHWLEQARRAQIDWWPAYGDMLVALLPRWGGSYEEMYDLGLACAATGRFDTLTPSFLLEALVRIARDDESTELWRQDGVYEAVAGVIEGYRASKELVGYQRNDRYWVTLHAAFAAAVGRYDVARAQLESIDGRIMAAPLDLLAMDEHALFRDVYAHTGPAGAHLADAESALAHGNVEGAIELYTDALAKIPPEQGPKKRRFDAHRSGDIDHAAFVRGKLRVAELLRDLLTGEWVDLRFDEDLAGWTPVHGTWRVVDERTVSGTSSKDGLLLLHDAPVGRRFEVEGTARFPETTERQRQHSAGVYFAAREGFEKPDWQAVAFQPTLDAVFIQHRWYTSERIEQPVKVEPTFRFRVQVWDDEVVARLEDEVVYAGRSPARGWRPGDRFGIGGLFWYRFADLQLTNLRIRLLAEPPEALPREEPAEDDWAPLMDMGLGRAAPAAAPLPSAPPRGV